MRKTMTRFGLLLGALMWLVPSSLLAQTVVKYVHTDALGSVVAMTNSSGGLIETVREYEPYGYQMTPAIQDGPGYTGHVQDAATGLTYMQQRYYDPMLGVFLSVDPVTAYEQPISQFHRYRYASNNPYKFIDPDGRQQRRPTPGNFNVSSNNIAAARAAPARQQAESYAAEQTVAVAKSVAEGNATLQVGVVTSGSGGGGGKVGSGLAIDTKGNVAIYTETGVHVGPKADVNAGITVQITTGETVNDLQGTSYEVSAGAGAGAHGAGNVSYAETGDGRTIVGVGVTIGPGAGAGGSAGATHTQVTPIIETRRPENEQR